MRWEHRGDNLTMIYPTSPASLFWPQPGAAGRGLAGRKKLGFEAGRHPSQRLLGRANALPGTWGGGTELQEAKKEEECVEGRGLFSTWPLVSQAFLTSARLAQGTSVLCFQRRFLCYGGQYGQRLTPRCPRGVGNAHPASCSRNLGTMCGARGSQGIETHHFCLCKCSPC